MSRDLNAEVEHALSYVRAWTETDKWPVGSSTCAARLDVKVEWLATDAEFAAAVGAMGDYDATLYCVWDWQRFVPVEGVLAVHCTQRLLRRCGLDPQDYEIVARVCVRLTKYLPDRSAVDWMLKVLMHMRGDVA